MKIRSSGPRPHTWKYQGILHDMHIPFLRSKAQAKFRSEIWELTLEEFYEIWKLDWHNRGTKSDSACMSRIDTSLPWNKNNTVIIQRSEQLIKYFIKRKPEGDENA